MPESGQQALDLDGPAHATAAPLKLAPSDFAFLYKQCKRCFYNKVVGGRKRPPSPFPSVFGRIDKAMKEYYVGRRAEQVSPDLPPGRIHPGNYVKAAPLWLSDSARPLLLAGSPDLIEVCDDGSLMILDCKTTELKEGHQDVYSPQLHSYGWAFTHPHKGEPREVSGAALLCFSPEGFTPEGISGSTKVMSIDFDLERFQDFLVDVGTVLSGPAPSPATGCQWCKMDDPV